MIPEGTHPAQRASSQLAAKQAPSSSCPTSNAKQPSAAKQKPHRHNTKAKPDKVWSEKSKNGKHADPSFLGSTFQGVWHTVEFPATAGEVESRDHTAGIHPDCANAQWRLLAGARIGISARAS